MDSASHYRHANLRERIVEHVFVGEALRELWQLDVTDVEVLRSEFDAHGYDLVMCRGAIVRHIQFKASTKRKPPKVSVHRSLYYKPSGCVLWIKVTDELKMGPYYWLGGAPGEPLPPPGVDFRATKGRRNKEGKRQNRPNHVDVPGSNLQSIENLSEVLVRLFGPLKKMVVS
jgi:hypothetical protein